ncbi:MAG: hypothetical protein WCH99_17905, partial [Verrucomicrobiota bacterium]
LLNSSQMQRKVEKSRMVEFQTSNNRQPAEIITGMYLGILSRYPTPAESAMVQELFKNGTASAFSRRQATVDLAWTLLNSSEFLYRH